MNGTNDYPELLALVERVGALYGVSAGELATMKATAMADPAAARSALAADLEAAAE